MFQGTGSDVGKTVLVAGLCRLARNRGLKVQPFKPQNMSNNAAIAVEGGEIGRGTWLQAFASDVEPSIHMNPVLLKPQNDVGSQIIVQGQVYGYAKGREYQTLKKKLVNRVMESYQRVFEQCDLVLVEGAGSPAEINLRDGDIANMGFARLADIPVILVGDIDRGGVIASLVGTYHILANEDCALIAGYLINKFRGDKKLFHNGLKVIADHTQWPCFGVIPWIDEVNFLPAEDSFALEHHQKSQKGRVKITVPILPHIANFDDLDPLRFEPDVDLIFVKKDDVFPSDSDLIILPGSKSTIADMQILWERGWADKIIAFAKGGGNVIGICGGYQMLGKNIIDPLAVEGTLTKVEGLSLMNVNTLIAKQKQTRNVEALHLPTNIKIKGYEIHLGETTGPDCAQGLFRIAETIDGASSSDGKIWGTYLHGLFQSAIFRKNLLKKFGAISDGINHFERLDEALNKIANRLENVIDSERLFHLAR
ncbi:cobyric acid synthase CobQ [Bartonella tamiae Th307]|uniref:Cobyric acid synthase n=2 Tax=Bartonella tamiae TaxID=373638 RepID=J0R0C5_9HYPH|nr:cobyric acid synthase CobQ [Bartonella tamiae Th239]EJF94816.1 cobyric acid synthase CobQ [Bartonella tamiae Th307]